MLTWGNSSTLSHDFYQVMIGKSNMSLYGWKQLIEWSLQHSCLSKDEYASIHGEWDHQWDKFLDWVIQEVEPEVLHKAGEGAGATTSS